MHLQWLVRRMVGMVVVVRVVGVTGLRRVTGGVNFAPAPSDRRYEAGTVLHMRRVMGVLGVRDLGNLGLHTCSCGG